MKIRSLKTFIPATNFAESITFYETLGFQKVWQTETLAEFNSGNHSFLLQKFSQDNFATNFMMHLLVENVDEVYLEFAKRIQQLNNVNVHITEPQIQPWGLKVSYLTDPSGVIWHLAQ